MTIVRGPLVCGLSLPCAWLSHAQFKLGLLLAFHPKHSCRQVPWQANLPIPGCLQADCRRGCRHLAYCSQVFPRFFLFLSLSFRFPMYLPALPIGRLFFFSVFFSFSHFPRLSSCSPRLSLCFVLFLPSSHHFFVFFLLFSMLSPFSHLVFLCSSSLSYGSAVFLQL